MPNKSGLDRQRQARQSVKALAATVADIERALASTARPGVKRLRALGERLDSFQKILGDTYAWGRKAMGTAYRRGAGAHFRQWRHALRYHRCHVQLLADLCPADLEGRLELIHRLADLLAEDGELDLCAEGLAPDPVNREKLLLIRERQQALRALARPLGKRLFSERPALFLRQLRAHWQEAFPAPASPPTRLAEAWRRLAPAPLLMRAGA